MTLGNPRLVLTVGQLAEPLAELATFKQRGKLRGTDDWVDMRHAIVYTVGAGLITRARMYLNREEALEAAGLSE